MSRAAGGKEGPTRKQKSKGHMEKGKGTKKQKGRLVGRPNVLFSTTKTVTSRAAEQIQEG